MIRNMTIFGKTSLVVSFSSFISLVFSRSLSPSSRMLSFPVCLALRVICRLFFFLPFILQHCIYYNSIQRLIKMDTYMSL